MGALSTPTPRTHAPESPLARIAREFLANPVAVSGLVLLGAILLLAILAPAISPQDPYDLAQLDIMDARVIGVHVLKNISIPIVTVTGLQFGTLIAFAIVTETIFAWPGMGKLLIDSIHVLDRPVIVAYLLIIVTFFIVINLLVDLAYSLLDPRVRLADAKA